MHHLQVGNAHYRAYSSQDLDITSTDQLMRVFKENQPDVVINCSGYTHVGGAEQEPDKAMRINGEAVGNIALLCSHFQSTLVHYSTDYVFNGSVEDRRERPNGFKEHHLPDPVNTYGESKQYGERQIAEFGDDFIIMRVSWLCGQYRNNFIKTMLEKADQQKQVDVVEDQYSAPTFAGEVVMHTLQLLQGGFTGLVHCSSHGVVSWYDLATEVFRQAGKKVKVNPVRADAFFKDGARRPHFSKLDPDLLSDHSSRSIIEWKDGVTRLLDLLKG